MATGDIKNNLRKLRSELKAIQFKENIQWEQINIGLTEPFLPMLHFLLADYSCDFSAYLLSKGYDFFGKSDLRFIEVLYKILVQEFSLKPMLTKQQFFSIGFAEMKVIFVTRILFLCRSKNNEFVRNRHGKNKMRCTNKSSKQSLMKDTVLEKCNDEVLTPVKATPKDIIVEYNDILDITDLDEDNNDASVLGSQVSEVVYNSYNSNLSDFVITKHNRSNVVERQKIPFKPKKIEAFQEFALVTPDSCKQCETNSNIISSLSKRLEHLENKFTDVLSINSELSAKLILLETKVKFMESYQTHEKEQEVMSSQEEQDNTVAEKSPGVIFDTIGNSLFTDDIPNKCTTSPNTALYSPIKYTDDEVIMKDFKPITMKQILDVEEAMCGNKENKEIKLCAPTNSDSRCSKTSFKEVDSNDVHFIVDSSNISFDGVSLNENTKQTMRSVCQRLKETQQMFQNKKVLP